MKLSEAQVAVLAIVEATGRAPSARACTIKALRRRRLIYPPSPRRYKVTKKGWQSLEANRG